MLHYVDSTASCVDQLAVTLSGSLRSNTNCPVGNVGVLNAVHTGSHMAAVSMLTGLVLTLVLRCAVPCCACRRECEKYALACANPDYGNLCFADAEESEAIETVRHTDALVLCIEPLVGSPIRCYTVFLQNPITALCVGFQCCAGSSGQEWCLALVSSLLWCLVDMPQTCCLQRTLHAHTCATPC